MKQSIKNTLSLRISTALVLIYIITAMVLILFTFVSVTKKYHMDVNNQANNFAEILAQHLWFFDLNAIQNLSHIAVQSSDIVGIRCYDHNDQIVHQTGSLNELTPKIISLPIIYEQNTAIGKVDLFFNNSSLEKTQKTIVITTLSIGLVSVVLILIIVQFFLTKHLEKPLIHLQNMMVAVSKGNYERLIPVDSKEEIKSLTEVFNEMSKAIVIREKDRLKADQKYRTLFNNSPDMYVSVSAADGRISECNDTLLHRTGYNRKEIIGLPVFELYHDSCVCEAQRAFQQFKDSGLVVDKELILKCRNGETVHVALNVSAVRDSNGNILHSISSLRDIDEKVKTEQSLKLSEERLRISTEMTNIAVWEYDLVTKQIERSGNHDTLYGLSRQNKWELDTFFYAIHPDDRDLSMEIISKSIKPGGTDDYRFDFRVIWPDSSIHWLQVMGVVTERDGHGRATAVRGCLIDITDRKADEEKQLNLEAQLQQAQKMESIGTLAGGIAHDFNNILSSIIGFTELAQEESPAGSAQREDLDEVLIAGNRAKDLIQQILTFARQSEEKTKPVRLSDIVAEVLKLLRPSTPTSIEIKSTIESTAKVMGNSSQLHQVVLNLCTNAMQALNNPGGVLEIELRNEVLTRNSDLENSELPSGEYVVLKISDDGPGIDPVIINNIFEPYFTTKDVGEGTGMGLAMVKGLVENYGGDIHVESVPEKRTSFVIRLPVATGKSSKMVLDAEQIIPGTERILFVDDEPPLALMGKRMLESLGYTVVTRTSSIEALELFREKPKSFDLIISDMTMPAMTGDMLVIETRKIRGDIPVILCTGYSNKINAERAALIGIDSIVYKPITKVELAKTIREVLCRRRPVLV